MENYVLNSSSLLIIQNANRFKHSHTTNPIHTYLQKTLQELQMLSHVTIYCQVTMKFLNPQKFRLVFAISL